MTRNDDAESVMRQFWDRIDARDWDGLAALLDPQLRASYVHTGEIFDPDGLVRVNVEYPGRWRGTVEDLVVSGDRAVSRARVTNGEETYYVASFATVRAGLIVELVEVWTNGVAAAAPSRRPG